MNEFSPSFDIGFVLGPPGPRKAGEEPTSSGAATGLDLRVRADRRAGLVAFQLSLTEPAAVDLDLYTVTGRHVRTLAHEWLPPGLHRFEWFGLDGRGRRVASGVYYYSLSAGRARQAGEIRLVR